MIKDIGDQDAESARMESIEEPEVTVLKPVEDRKLEETIKDEKAKVVVSTGVEEVVETQPKAELVASPIPEPLSEEPAEQQTQETQESEVEALDD